MVTCQYEYPQFDLFIRNKGLNAPFGMVDEMIRAIDEIDELRAKVWEFERPERERREVMDRWQAITAAACARGIHAVTRWNTAGGKVCSDCGAPVSAFDDLW